MTDDVAAAAPRTAPAWRFGVLAAAGAMGTSAVAPALNDIATALALSEAAVAGIVSAYTVPYAAATIIAAQIVDHHGPRRVFRVALLLGIAGSVAAAAAPNALVLLLGRALAGVGGGAITLAAYDVARRTPGGIPATAAALTLGASSGPLIGGLATAYVGWQIAVVLPAILLVTGLVGLGSPQTGDGRGAIDGVGLALTGVGAAAGAGGLQLARSLPAAALPLGALGGLLLVSAAVRALRGRGAVPPRPILVVEPLRRRGLLAASIAGTYFASLVLVPVGLGQDGYGAIAIGFLLFPAAVSGSIAARRSDDIAARLGRWTDPAASTATAAVLASILLAPPVLGALSLVLLAASYGLVQPRLLAAVSAEVDDGPATAIGTANLVLLLGGGIGSAVIGGFGRGLGGGVLAALVAAVSLNVWRGALRTDI